MKSQLISLIVFLISASASVAQDTIPAMVSKNRYLNFDFGVGYQHNDLSSINNFLVSYGYKPNSENAFTLSFSPSFMVNRFVFRAEYTRQFPVTTQQSEDTRSTFGGRHIAVSAGYV